MKMGNKANPKARWSIYNRKSCIICSKLLFRGSLSERCNKHRIYPESARHKIRLAHLGKKHTLESRQKMSGKNAPNWQGGITAANKLARNNTAYQEWRKAVFERDNYRCLACGLKGVYLQADHIYPSAYYPRLRYDINNGQTLCIDCHKQTPTFAGKAKQYAK